MGEPCDTILPYRYLSQIVAGVAKTSVKSLHNFCPPSHIALPLRCDKAITIAFWNDYPERFFI